MNKKAFLRAQRNYESGCEMYITLFCKKHNLAFLGWVGNTVGETAVCNDFYFNMSDIVYDLNTEQPEHMIINWYYDCVAAPDDTTNYPTFCIRD